MMSSQVVPTLSEQGPSCPAEYLVMRLVADEFELVGENATLWTVVWSLKEAGRDV